MSARYVKTMPALTAWTMSLLLFSAACEAPPGPGAGRPGVRAIGGPGRGDGRFVTPRGLSVQGDRVLVVDRSGRVQELDRAGRFRRAIRVTEGTKGFPLGVLGMVGGGFLLCDTHASRIRLFDGRLVEQDALGDPEAGATRFQCPQRAVQDAAGRLYVADYGVGDTSRILVFDAAMNPLPSIGSEGRGHLTRPMALVRHRDELIVADASDRLIVFGLDGDPRREFGGHGQQPGAVRYPSGLAMIGDTLYVAEYGNHRVQRFDSAGRSGGWVQHLGPELGDLSGPWDLDVDEAGRLWVCDTGNHRLVVFSPADVDWAGGES